MTLHLLRTAVLIGTFYAVITGVSAFAADSPGARAAVRADTYKGWKSHRLANGLVELQVVPEIGGRVIQYKLGQHEFLWVSPELAGKSPPPSGLGPGGEWLNYGGDKLWPAPQGWRGDGEWPGPPDAVLDGSPHSATVLKRSGASIRLTSREDKRSGIQFVRTIRLIEGSTRVVFDVTMKNIDTRPRRWGIWTVTQIDGRGDGVKGSNPELVAWCPLNPHSRYPGGFNVIFGARDNPTFRAQADLGLMQLQYQYKVGKVGLDSAAGWTATVNGANGNVFVQRFRFEPDKEYPDDASVEFWSSGLGSISAGGSSVEMKDDPRETPQLIECELLSPFAKLVPGESYSWRYEWAACNIGRAFPVRDCTELGLVAQPLTITNSSAETVRVAGRFGVFQPATARIVFLDANGKRIGRVVHSAAASPLAPLIIDVEAKRPARAVAVGVFLGSRDASVELSRTRLP